MWLTDGRTVEISSTAAQGNENTFGKAHKRWMILKVTQCHRNCRYSMAIHHFLLLVCSNNNSILHRFSDIITHLWCTWLPWPWKILRFRNKKNELQATWAFWFIFKHVVENRPTYMYYIFWSRGVRKVSKSKSDLEGDSRALAIVPLIGHIGFPISVPLQLCPLITKFIEITWLSAHTF